MHLDSEKIMTSFSREFSFRLTSIGVSRIGVSHTMKKISSRTLEEVRHGSLCANFVSRTLIFSKEINSVYSRGRDPEK